MTTTLPLGSYIMRVVVPLAGVLASVVLLVAATALLLFDPMSDALRQALFAAGVLSWMFGIGWGVVVNAKPLAPSSQG